MRESADDSISKPSALTSRWKVIRKFFGRNPFQLILLTAGEDRDGNLVDFGGGEHEVDVRRGLFQRFQQGIERLGGQHVHFVDDNYFKWRRGGKKTNFFLELTDLLNSPIGCTVYFIQIQERNPW